MGEAVEPSCVRTVQQTLLLPLSAQLHHLTIHMFLYFNVAYLAYATAKAGTGSNQSVNQSVTRTITKSNANTNMSAL